VEIGMSIEWQSKIPPTFLHNALDNFYLVPYPLADIYELTYHTKNSGVIICR